MKTRRIAEATRQATLKTQLAVSRNFLLSDISNTTQNLNEIRSLVRDKQYKIAQTRINVVISQLLQVKEVLKLASPQSENIFNQILKRLAVIRKDFEKKLSNDSVKINAYSINSQIDLITDELNQIIGSAKVIVEE